MAKLTKNLAPLFDSSISYEPGERFMYGDHMYEVIEPLTGVFDLTKVSEVTLADIFKGVSSNDVKCLAPEYDVNTEYSVENLVLHDGVLYECVETTTGPFDETKWSRKYLSDVGGLNSNLAIKKWSAFMNYLGAYRLCDSDDIVITEEEGQTNLLQFNYGDSSHYMILVAKEKIKLYGIIGDTVHNGTIYNANEKILNNVNYTLILNVFVHPCS